MRQLLRTFISRSDNECPLFKGAFRTCQLAGLKNSALLARLLGAFTATALSLGGAVANDNNGKYSELMVA